VPRSMPTAMRRWCGSGDHRVRRSAREPWQASQRFAGADRCRQKRSMNMRALTWDAAAGHRRLRRAGAAGRQRGGFGASRRRHPALRRGFDRGVVERLAPLHLLHQEGRGHRVLFSASMGAPRSARTGRRRAGAGHAGAGRPRSRARPIASRRAGRRRPRRRSGRGGPRPAATPARVDVGAVLGRCGRPNSEVVVGQAHGENKAKGAVSPRLSSVSEGQTRKDSPQPQRSFSRGLWNLKPSFRPSRTKSSSVPSM
jgi:hypothetical protein